MRYMLLIYNEEASWGAMSEQEQGRIFGEYMAYTEDIQANGQHLAGDPLQPIATATTVRVRDGKTLTTDGPFAETKEILGGYYLVDVPSLDEALAWAERCPGAQFGTIEVRPLMEFDMPEAGG
jgi:hypothetical protein